MKTALIILAEGFEELEAVTVMDLLVRASIQVTSAGLKPGAVKASRHTVIVPGTTLDEVLMQNFDLIVLPGGLPGADNLAADSRVLTLLQKQYARHGLIAAICAAPRVLLAAGIIEGKRFTCYPNSLDPNKCTSAKLTGEAVTVDLPLITSRGPGTAMDFALTLIEHLAGKPKRDEVERGLVR